MPEKTIRNETGKTDKTPPEKREDEEKGNWSQDQREKSYYYNDSYGYEIYNPDEDEDDNENC